MKRCCYLKVLYGILILTYQVKPTFRSQSLLTPCARIPISYQEWVTLRTDVENSKRYSRMWGCKTILISYGQSI